MTKQPGPLVKRGRRTGQRTIFLAWRPLPLGSSCAQISARAATASKNKNISPLVRPKIICSSGTLGGGVGFVFGRQAAGARQVLLRAVMKARPLASLSSLTAVAEAHQRRIQSRLFHPGRTRSWSAAVNEPPPVALQQVAGLTRAANLGFGLPSSNERAKHHPNERVLKSAQVTGCLRVAGSAALSSQSKPAFHCLSLPLARADSDEGAAQGFARSLESREFRGSARWRPLRPSNEDRARRPQGCALPLSPSWPLKTKPRDRGRILSRVISLSVRPSEHLIRVVDVNQHIQHSHSI